MSRTSSRNGAVGLGRHPVGAAEIVEVVDVGRAEIDLQRLEHPVGRHAEHLGAHPVDVGIDLGRARVEQREDAGQAGRPGWRRPTISCVAASSAGRPRPRLSCDHHLEAAGGADAAHRRRRDHDDEGVLDLAQPADADRAEDDRRSEPLGDALLERLQGEKIAPALGALVKVAPSKPGERHGVGDALGLAG